MDFVTVLKKAVFSHHSNAMSETIAVSEAETFESRLRSTVQKVQTGPSAIVQKASVPSTLQCTLKRLSADLKAGSSSTSKTQLTSQLPLVISVQPASAATKWEETLWTNLIAIQTLCLKTTMDTVFVKTIRILDIHVIGFLITLIMISLNRDCEIWFRQGTAIILLTTEERMGIVHAQQIFTLEIGIANSGKSSISLNKQSYQILL